MGKGICVLLWSVLKVSYIGVSIRSLEQICDTKASFFTANAGFLIQLCHPELSSATAVMLAGACEGRRAGPLLLLSSFKFT